MTYKQAESMKAHVKKGEKGTIVVYADKFTKEEQKADGTVEKQQIPFLKQYVVFNASQIEGLSDDFYKTITPEVVNQSERIDTIEKFLSIRKQMSDKVQEPPTLTAMIVSKCHHSSALKTQSATTPHSPMK